jgi:predicted nucleic acid-binding protein
MNVLGLQDGDVVTAVVEDQALRLARVGRFLELRSILTNDEEFDRAGVDGEGVESMDGCSLCLDTSALIAYLKEREPAAAVVAHAVQKARCAVTAMTMYENFLRDRPGTTGDWRGGAAGCAGHSSPGRAAARRAAHLHDWLIRRNEDIGIKDVLVVSVCLEHSLPLLTLNERNYLP